MLTKTSRYFQQNTELFEKEHFGLFKIIREFFPYEVCTVLKQN